MSSNEKKMFRIGGRNRLSLTGLRVFRPGSIYTSLKRKPREDSRSVMARRLDNIVGVFLIWLSGFFIFASITSRPALALALSLPLLFVASLVLNKVWQLRRDNMQRRRQLWQDGQRFLEEVHKMDPNKEFVAYVQDILGHVPGFDRVTNTAARPSADTAKTTSGIDLTGLYRDVPLAVRCLTLADDKKLSAAEVKDFAAVLQNAGYQNGLLVTLSDFGSGVARAVQDAARKGSRVRLVSRYQLADLARQAGCGAFKRARPSLESVQGTIAGAAKTAAVDQVIPGKPGPSKRQATMAAFLEAGFGSRDKARSYFFYGFLLSGGHLLLKSSALLGALYLFFASLNFLMGACCLYFGKTLEEMDPLEGIGTDN